MKKWYLSVTVATLMIEVIMLAHLNKLLTGTTLLCLASPLNQSTDSFSQHFNRKSSILLCSLPIHQVIVN